jgi:hypothetical protein
MLEKEFVPYPEALELKQLDFDEPCFGRFDGRGKNKGKIWYEMPNTGQDSIPVGDVLAPTYSQAFRWFREKHHLIGGVEYIGGATPSTTWWDIYVVGHFNTNTSKMTMKYQPYEEAELACLRKLIEIVKNKQK